MKLSTLSNNWNTLWPMPSGSFRSLSKRVDELFDSFFGEPLSVFKTSGFPYNVREKEVDNKVVAHVVEVALAGVNKDRVSVSLEENGTYAKYPNLHIQVKKSEEKKDAIYQKISDSSYHLTLTLNETHDLANISSELKDGLLTVNIPVIQVEKPKPSCKVIEVK